MSQTDSVEDYPSVSLKGTGPFTQMQILVAILVVMALWSADALRDSPGGQMAWSLLVVLYSAIGVVAFAWILTRESVRRRLPTADADRGSLKWLATVQHLHSIAWVGSAILICFVAKWGVIVRYRWGLENAFLIDELLIITPIILPLIASWFVFGGNSTESAIPNETVKQNLVRRLRYCGLRVQVYVALTFVPMIVLWLANDGARWFAPGHQEWIQWTVLALAFVVATICFPWLLTLVWPNEKLTDTSIRNRIDIICREKNLWLSDVRIWKTGNQVTNAMVAGFFWPCRIIWLSDRIMQLLDAEELDAVLRHEIGHARRLHLPLRMLFLLLPILMMSVLLAVFPSQLQQWAERLGRIGISESWLGWVLLPSLGILYLVWTISWISHSIEKDADIEACLATETTSGSPIVFQLDFERLQHYKSALTKIADQIPGGIHRQTLLHPSILERSLFLSKIALNPAKLQHFRRQFLVKMAAMAFCALAVCLIVVLV